MSSHRTWSRLGAAGILLGLLSLMITSVLQWVLQADAESPVLAADRHAVLWTVCALLALCGPLLWAAGVVVVVLRVPGRGWVLTTVGGAVTALGFGAGVGHLALFFGLISDLAGAGATPATATALEQADSASVVSTVLLVAFLVGFSLGPIVLTAGLRRAGLVPVWGPVAAVVAAVADFAGGPVAAVVQLLALIAAFGPVALVLIRAAGGEARGAADLERGLAVAR